MSPSTRYTVYEKLWPLWVCVVIIAALWIHQAIAANAQPTAEQHRLEQIRLEVESLEQRTKQVAHDHAVQEVERRFNEMEQR